MGNFDKEYDAIRDRIFELLGSEPITQKEFSKIVDVSPQTISDWKTGKNRSFMKKLPLIAYALRSTTEWIMSGQGHRSGKDERSEQAFKNLMEMSGIKRSPPSSPVSEDELKGAFFDSAMSGEDDNFKRRLISVLSRLNEGEWGILERRLREIVGEESSEQNGGSEKASGPALDAAPEASR